MKKKVLSLVVALSMLICTTALANVITPFYAEVNSITATLSISGSTATCSGTVEPQKSGVKSSVSVSLQQKDGSNWKTMKTWTGSGSTTAGAVAEGTCTISSGTYRVYTSGSCGSESVSKYSGEKTI